MTITLRPRQVKAIEDLRAAYRAGHVAPLLRASTGFGKTATAVTMIRSAVQRGHDVWFLAHLKEILDDTDRRLRAAGIPHTHIRAGFDHDRTRSVKLVSVQTAVRRLDRIARPTMIIVDEAHLAVAQTYQDIFEWAQAGPKFHKPGGAKLLSLTATPGRLDGRGMGEIADIIVETCSTAELIDEELLAPVRYYAPPGPDLAGVSSLGGDFNRGELAAAMDKPKITGSAVEHYLRVAHGRRTIAFCVSIEHAKRTAEAFNAAGVRARAVSGDTDPAERDQALLDLREGRLDVVANCQLFVAGVDVDTVSCIILLAPTQSLTKYLQSVGRGLRTAPGKPDCIILDHAGNLARHGSPLDARVWTLEGARKAPASTEKVAAIKTCPACFATVSALATHCLCGHAFQVKPRTLAEVEGELAEIELRAAQAAEEREKLAQAAALAQRQARVAQGRASKLEELIALATARGYRRPEMWARAVLRGRAERDERRRA